MSGKDYRSYPSNMEADSICDRVSTASTEPSIQPSAPPLVPDGGANLYPDLANQRQQHLLAASSPSLTTQSSFVQYDSVPLDGYEIVRMGNLPLFDNYSRHVTHIGTITYSRSKVMGMVLLSPFLYAIHKRPSVLCKYNITNTSPSAFIVPPVSNQTISDLQYPRGLAANRRTGNLFLTDRRKIFGSTNIGRVLKVSVDGAMLAHADFDFEPFGVSVGEENERIIVACSKCPSPVSLPLMGSGYILIFDDVGGDRLRQQHLISLEESIDIPRHVIEAPNPARPGHGKEYLVAHGWTKLPTVESHHRVSRVSSQGRVMTKFGTGHGNGERQLDRPMSLCLDDSDKMFVADCGNDRVLLLSRNPSENHDLELVRPLVTVANGLHRPRHVCLERSKRLLFVGEDSGSIEVFLVGEDSNQRPQPT